MSEAKKIAKKHGQSVNQLVREDCAKIHHGKKTGKRIFDRDIRRASQKDRMKMAQRQKSGNGKGDAPRSCFSSEYRDNYDDIFGKKKKRRGGKTVKKYK
jgi:hypothetical protein